MEKVWMKKKEIQGRQSLTKLDPRSKGLRLSPSPAGGGWTGSQETGLCLGRWSSRWKGDVL